MYLKFLLIILRGPCMTSIQNLTCTKDPLPISTVRVAGKSSELPPCNGCKHLTSINNLYLLILVTRLLATSQRECAHSILRASAWLAKRHPCVAGRNRLETFAKRKEKKELGKDEMREGEGRGEAFHTSTTECGRPAGRRLLSTRISICQKHVHAREAENGGWRDGGGRTPARQLD